MGWTSSILESSHSAHHLANPSFFRVTSSSAQSSTLATHPTPFVNWGFLLFMVCFFKSLTSRGHAYSKQSKSLPPPMMSFRNLSASVQETDQLILHNVGIDFYPGKLHIILGHNGSGKSTLGKAIIGDESYSTVGKIIYKGEEIQDLSMEERAQRGIFVSYQNPVEIDGLNNMEFLRLIKGTREKRDVDVLDFHDDLAVYLDQLDISPDLGMARSVNAGYSGGQKKKNELLQALVLQPDFCFFDEVDSGMDKTALQKTTEIIESLRTPSRCLVLITHYSELVEKLQPDFIHTMKQGQFLVS